MKKEHIFVEWTGSYPCLCYGKWVIKIDGKNCSKAIPKEQRTHPMNTLKTYHKWHFEDWNEVWEDYTCGLSFEDWISANDYWIKKLPIAVDDYKELYDKIREQDFKEGSCGGCI